MRAAAFLDRDGTLIHDANYLGDPEGVRLLPGAATAVRRLNQAGLPVLLVTNQSGIGRGYLSEKAYLAVHQRLVELLAAEEPDWTRRITVPIRRAMWRLGVAGSRAPRCFSARRATTPWM